MLCPEELAAAVTAAAVSISRGLDISQTALLAAVFTQLADTLTTLATAKDRCEQICGQSGNATKKTDDIKPEQK